MLKLKKLSLCQVNFKTFGQTSCYNIFFCFFKLIFCPKTSFKLRNTKHCFSVFCVFSKRKIAPNFQFLHCWVHYTRRGSRAVLWIFGRLCPRCRIRAIKSFHGFSFERAKENLKKQYTEIRKYRNWG